ncbi:MAG: efflux RND transporter periplasmic adaptor subunit [Rhodocyclaceae bacterium]
MRLTRALLAAAVIGLLGAAAWYAMRPAPVAAVLWTVEKGRVESTVANTRAATVSACRRAKLSPSLGGRIARLPVREGDRVTAGQVLLEIWNEDLGAQIAAARSQIESARARAEQSCRLADVAGSEALRQQSLHERGFVSAERAERSGAEARASRAGCEAARGEDAQARARLRVAQAELSRSVLKAPFAGIVAKINGELGEQATPSPPGIPTPPAIDLIDDSCLYVSAPIDEVDVPAIRLGMQARISVDSYPGRRFAGRVRRIAPYVLDVEKQARTAEVEVEFADPREAGALLVGYSADAEIVLGVREDVVRVPSAALSEGKRVLVFRGADGILEERKVETGLANWEFTEITRGLAAGERITVSLDRPGVKAGARVEPEAAAATAGK